MSDEKRLINWVRLVILIIAPGGGAFDPKLGSMCGGQKKITGPLLVQTLQEISGKRTLSANLS